MTREDVEETIDNLESAILHDDDDGINRELLNLIGGMALNLAKLVELAARAPSATV